MGKLCGVCGNPVENRTTICPFCEQPTGISSGPRQRSDTVRVLNLKNGQPSTDEAERLLRSKLIAYRQESVRVVKVIHGWGSNGVGGAIRDRVHDVCQMLQAQRAIRLFVPGEAFSTYTQAGRTLVAQYPQLKRDSDFDAGNKGISLIVF